MICSSLPYQNQTDLIQSRLLLRFCIAASSASTAIANGFPASAAVRWRRSWTRIGRWWRLGGGRRRRFLIVLSVLFFHMDIDVLLPEIHVSVIWFQVYAIVYLYGRKCERETYPKILTLNSKYLNVRLDYMI